MKKIIINENQKGLLFKNGKYVRLLTAGKYYLYGGRDIEVMNTDTNQPLRSAKCSLGALLTYADIAENVTAIDVKDEQLALFFVNGKFFTCLPRGRYAFWNTANEYNFIFVDISKPEVDADFPRYIFDHIPAIYYKKIEVEEYEKALVYFDKKLCKTLGAGTHYFWNGKAEVESKIFDTRLTQLDITGQEILTQDKVSLRINLVCNYRITDCVKIAAEINDFKEQLHVAAQLALREYVGRYKLDEILENKEGLSEYVYGKLKEKENELFVEIPFAGVKDIILPGEIREIMNTVLVAEKRAQANVITRREEVASTRSLLNTAKLMDENKTLYKLKELEYIERICENVGTLTLNGNGDILSQITGMLKGGTS